MSGGESATARDLKAQWHAMLRAQRAALLDKLDGVGERQARTPRTPTGTNLLGLVKHSAAVELGYFGETFAPAGCRRRR